jgi:predicted O-methyltransferase YrrM
MREYDMSDARTHLPPGVIQAIEEATQAINYTMGSDLLTGSLLRTLVATKPAGTILELGTGTGLGTAWLLDGMDAAARLITVDRNEDATAIARRFLARDARLSFVIMEGDSFIATMTQRGKTFDFIFANMQPGKFELLEETLNLLKVGGIYVVDDLLPLPTWEKAHVARVAAFIRTLEQRQDLRVTRLNWSTGLLLAAKILPPQV